jgi:hypothetical protein
MKDSTKKIIKGATAILLCLPYQVKKNTDEGGKVSQLTVRSLTWEIDYRQKEGLTLSVLGKKLGYEKRQLNRQNSENNLSENREKEETL